jgi:methylglyoxal synthase
VRAHPDPADVDDLVDRVARVGLPIALRAAAARALVRGPDLDRERERCAIGVSP